MAPIDLVAAVLTLPIEPKERAGDRYKSDVEAIEYGRLLFEPIEAAVYCGLVSINPES